MKVTIELTASEAAKLLTLAIKSNQTVGGTLHKLVSDALHQSQKKARKNKYPRAG